MRLINLDYSVVLPVRNGETFIQSALDSINSQHLQPRKIIVVDDHSVHPVSDILQPQINLEILTATSEGQMAALNQGIGAVTSEFISFIAHDDCWADDRQLRHNGFFRETNTDCVASSVVNFHESAINLQGEFLNMGPSRVLGACTFKTEVFSRVGLFKEKIQHHGVIEWWARAESIGIEVYRDKSPGLYRRIHGSNSGLVSKLDARKSLLSVLRQIPRGHFD